MSATSESNSVAPFKLRYACHLGFLSRDRPLFHETLGTAEPTAHIAYAATQGFAGIEDNWFMSREAVEQARIGEALNRFGLELGCFVVSFDPSDYSWVSHDEQAIAKIDAEIAAGIEAAKRGSGRYMVMAPAALPGVPFSIQLTNVIRHLRRVAGMCERAGVILCIEQTNRFGLPGMLLQHVLDAWAVVRTVESPAVKLLFDFYHVQQMDGNLVANFRQCRDEIAISQIADLPGRCKLGDSEINWPAVLRAVRDSGYRGLIEYEVVPATEGEAGEQAALEALRRVDAAI
jgi:hydroxypyruvate isomerase